ncbi:MAG TPA: thioredoxin domain-containing protein, partial [Aeromicrobium sp.]|nr:thioredoxin domain-containing protein [Aeromicrobium sp.]
EDPETAAYMNEHFVPVKVDREERPDVDAVYMQATQAMTGHGGWPMTCVLTPDGEPFFTGTYFPPEPRQGSPAFTQVLQALADAWENRRDEVVAVGRDVVGYLGTAMGGLESGDGLSAGDLDAAVGQLATQFDEQGGGFGSAPKFPPSMVLEFLLRHHARTGDPRSLLMVERTCESMARSGTYDQLAGGFARYGVDRFWRVPHFEKMLYDNAQLLRVYLHLACRGTPSLLAKRVATETAEFLLAELQTADGGFASALDADSVDEQGELHEGAFYRWNRSALENVLGEEDGRWAAELLGVTEIGTFEHGFSTLQLHRDPDDPARWQRIRQSLAAARAARAWPARDDKVVAAWNGLAITALAEASILLDEPRYGLAATTAASLLVEVHGAETDRFSRTSRDGKAGTNAAVLDDLGCVAEAFVAVLGITGDPVWLDRARALLDRAITHFSDGAGGFFDTADDAEQLVVRPRDASDNASPGGVSALVNALIAFAAVTGEHHYRDAAEGALGTVSALARQAPRFAGWTLAAGEALLAGPSEVAIVGPPGPERTALHQAALSLPGPAVVVSGERGLAIPLFEERAEVDGRPAAYVCRDFVCALPVTDPAQLGALSESRGTPAG